VVEEFIGAVASARAARVASTDVLLWSVASTPADKSPFSELSAENNMQTRYLSEVS